MPRRVPVPRRRPSLRKLGASVATVLALTLGSCSGGVVLEPTDGPVLEARKMAQAARPSTDVTGIDTGTPAEVALRASQTYFESAQIVVLASTVEPAAHAQAASMALTLGVPFLLTAEPGANIAGQSLAEHDGNASVSGSLNTELLRLGTRAVITVGEVSLHQIDTTSLVVQPAPTSRDDMADLLGTEITLIPAPAPTDEMNELLDLQEGQIYLAEDLGTGPVKYGRLPGTLPAVRNAEVITLATTSTRHFAGVATARAAGSHVFINDDPGAEAQVVAYAASKPNQPVVGFGEDLDDEPQLQRLVKTLRTGVTLPTGAQRVFRLDDSAARVLTVAAEQAFQQPGMEHAGDILTYAHAQAQTMERASTVPVVPGVEVNAAETSAADLDYWIAQARDHNQYLVLTVRARGAPVAAVQQLGSALAHPHVGVRVDLSGHDEVTAEEINEITSHVRSVVRGNRLPQKIVVIDFGATTQLASGRDVMPATAEVALTISAVSDVAETRLDSLRKAITSTVAWGTSVLPEENDDEDDRLRYPGLEQIRGHQELDLVAYR